MTTENIIPFERRAKAPQADPVGLSAQPEGNPFAAMEASGRFECGALIPLDQPIEALASLIELANEGGWKATGVQVRGDGTGIVVGLAVAARVIDGGRDATTPRNQDKPAQRPALVSLPSAPTSPAPMSYSEDPA